MKEVLISVIIPVYNAQNYLKECLDSILSQTLKEIEIICIDDGSTDDSYEIIEEYGRQYPNIVILRQKNQGAGNARNNGIAHAIGKYVCFMDADDYYAGSNVLELLYNKAEENQVLACGGNLISIFDNGLTKKQKNLFQENKKWQFEKYGNLYHYQCYIFNLRIIRDNNIQFPPYMRFQDPPFLLNVMGYIKEFYAVTDVVYIYRVGHKEVNYDINKVCDLLQGIRDCYKIARNNNYINTYTNYLKCALMRYFIRIYPYTRQNNREVWRLIHEINDISMSWLGEYTEILLDYEHMESYVKEIKRNRTVMIERCKEAKEVIIYGAGKAGKTYLQSLEHEGIHVTGFAVSKKDTEEFFEKYPIRLIEEYDKESIVVVAVGEKYAAEMLDNLKHLHFENVCYMKYRDFLISEQIEE